jgi:hypothetical protein
MPGPIVTPASSPLKWLARLRVGATTKRHNRLALRAYEDLAHWASEERKKETQAVAAADAASREWGLSGLAREGEAEIRAAFRENWRNQKSQTARYVQDLQDKEAILHAAWRYIRRRPWPENPHRDEIERLARGWEE